MNSLMYERKKNFRKKFFCGLQAILHQKESKILNLLFELFLLAYTRKIDFVANTKLTNYFYFRANFIKIRFGKKVLF